MYQPARGMLFHPRNKNISLGALIEAIYYTKVQRGEPDDSLLAQLRNLVEHCTGCGKCTAVCPVKIDSPAAALDMRAMLESEGAGGHPVKSRILEALAKNPAHLVPLAAKAASVGQAVANRAVGLVPAPWRGRMKSPLFSAKGPSTRFRNLAETLKLGAGSLFVPENHSGNEAVFYFPGCGAGLFYSTIGLAAVQLLLDAGTPVVLPPEHLCCGYPLLVSGCEEAFAANRTRNVDALESIFARTRAVGFNVRTVLTSCGSCRDGLARYELVKTMAEKPVQMDVTQFLMERTPSPEAPLPGRILYHASCHAEWAGLKADKAPKTYAAALAALTGADVTLSPGCCGESGLGALTSPDIYNAIRGQKQLQLEQDLRDLDEDAPVLVGCPSCKVGIKRSLMQMDKDREVLHTLEFLARAKRGDDWAKTAARLRGK